MFRSAILGSQDSFTKLTTFWGGPSAQVTINCLPDPSGPPGSACSSPTAIEKEALDLKLFEAFFDPRSPGPRRPG